MSMKRFKQFILEASEGEAKWNKYFVSNADVSTKVKKSDYLYTLDGKKTSDRVNSGDLIIVKSNQNYDSKPIITYNKDEYRLPLNSIEKPINRKVSFQLKPDQLGIGSNIPVKNYLKDVSDKINSKEGLTPEIKEYLIKLVENAFDPSIDVREAFFNTNPDTGFINTINNDFMEVVGPVYAIKNLGLSRQSIIDFPAKGNEALLDFRIYDKGQEFIFSSKTSAKKKTNLLNPKDVLAALEGKNVDEQLLNPLKIVSSNPVKKCPEELAKYLNINYKPIKTSKDLLDLEKLVVKTLNDSIGKDKWTKLVRLAIKELYIVKMHIDKNGKPIFEGAKKGLDINEVYWRTKNSPNHWDRIGFQL